MPTATAAHVLPWPSLISPPPIGLEAAGYDSAREPCVIAPPRMETVEFQFGTGRLFVVTLVTAVPATWDRNVSPAILMLRSCSAFPLKSRLLRTALGYMRAP